MIPAPVYVPAGQWQAPPPGALHGELTEDGREIILLATGNAVARNQVALRLSKITALCKDAMQDGRPTGAVTVPATWANAVQLGHSFPGGSGLAWVPHERLAGWLAEEVARRYSEPAELVSDWPAWKRLRDYQAEAARKIGHTGHTGYHLLLDDPGLGKCQPETTPVWTPSGWTELGSLHPGSVVYDRYGRPVRVRAVHHQGERPVYRVTFSDRTSTLADGNHLWRVWTKNDRNHRDRTGHEHGRVLTTDQIREAGLRYADDSRKFYLPQQPVLLGGFGFRLPLDPYAYGALLGDGCLGGEKLGITSPDQLVLQDVKAAAAALGTTSRLADPPDRCLNLTFHRDGDLRRVLGNLDALKPAGTKAVHSRYLAAAVHERRALLAGLLDTDGSVADGCIEFSSASPQLAADVAWLSRSLGAVVTESDPQPAGYRDGNGERVPCQDKHRLAIRFPADGPNPFRAARKAGAWTAMAAGLQRKNPPRMFESVEPAGTARVCCIELDTDDENARVYLTDTSLIPTHNTAATLAGIDQRRLLGTDVFPMVILVPTWDVADVWEREIAAWCPPEWGVPDRYEGVNRARLLRHSGVKILITTYATARRDAALATGPLAKFGPKTVVIDECVPYSTRITVPGGVKMIAGIKPGDLVRGVDHETGQPVWTPVRRVMRSPLRPLVSIGTTQLTAEHPVWVSDDGSLCYADDYARHVHDHLRAMRGASGENPAAERPGAPVLQHVLLSQVADEPSGLRGVPGFPGKTGGSPAERDQGAQLPEDGRVPGVGPEPVQGPGYPREGPRHAREPGLAPVAGRERPGAYYPAGEVARAAGAGMGAGAEHPDRDAPGLWLPSGLQGGYRAPGPDDRDRGTRAGARQDRETPRPEETGPAGVPGLDSAVDLERGDPGRSLWNLETGTGNYFADGLLVHNCHLIKNVNAKQSHAARNIARHAITVVILSGTLITRNMGDAYAPLNAGDPGTWHDKKRFVQRFCWTSYDPHAAEAEPAGLNPYTAAEFRSCLLGQMTRRSKADVLPELPPKIYSVRRPEIPREWRKAYREMARDMLAALPGNDEELSVMDTLAQLTRLSQLASSAADVRWEMALNKKTGEMEPKQVVTLRPPSWKAESAMEILAERRGDPVILFTVSEQLARITGEHYLRPAGLRFGYVTGLRKGVTRATRNRDIAAFQAGELDAIICTSAAGGLGITLSRAGTEVNLQRPWPLDQSIQQEDRANRLGAEQWHDHQEIIDIVAKGTVDERVRELLAVKAGQLAEFVQDPRIVRDLLGGLG